MKSLEKLMLAAIAGFTLLMASHAQAGYIKPDLGYSGSSIAANFRQLGGAATQDQGDDTHFSFVLPFDFNFYGRSYDKGYAGWISSNGLLGFDPLDDSDTKQSEGYCCDAARISGAPLNTIHAGWFDMYGNVRTQTDGVLGNREFVITWDSNEYDPTSDSGIGALNLFQAILHEGSNDIEFQYSELNNQHHYATVGGIRGGELSEGLSFIDFSQDVQLTGVGLSIHFNPDDVAVPGGVPEPGAVVLSGLALGALLLSRRGARRGRAA
jgi:hypothetical protein